MVTVAQLVRASDCGSEGRGFETHQSPGESRDLKFSGFFFILTDGLFGEEGIGTICDIPFM